MTAARGARYLAMLLLWLAGASLAQENAPTLRLQMQQPLDQANTLIANGSYADAMSRINAAEQLGSLSPYETYVINRLRGLAAIGLDDRPAAMRAYDKVLRSGYTTGTERQQMLEVLMKLSGAAQDYGKLIEYGQQYQDAGGSKPEVLGVLPHAYYQTQQYTRAAQAMQALLQQRQSAGLKPEESQLQLLQACALMQKDEAALTASLMQLVRWYPTRDRWQQLIERRVGTLGYWHPAALDLDRLRLATESMSTADDYLFGAQHALQAGLPAEAQQFLDAGRTRRLIGQGPQAQRHQRLAQRLQAQLQADAAEQAALEREASAQRDGVNLLQLGMRRVSLEQYEPGLQLMREGLSRGGFADPQLAGLRLAYAEQQAGQQPAASEQLRALQGEGPVAALAELWLLRSKQGAY